MQPLTAARLLSATGALCLSLAAYAGRPLTVDDAGVNEAGGGQIEAWWEGQRGQRGSVYPAPTYAPVEGLESGVLLARDREERSTLQGLQAKWQGTPSL